MSLCTNNKLFNWQSLIFAQLSQDKIRRVQTEKTANQCQSFYTRTFCLRLFNSFTREKIATQKQRKNATFSTNWCHKKRLKFVAHGSNVNPLKSRIRAVSGKITGSIPFEVLIDVTGSTLQRWFPLKTSLKTATLELQREPQGP